MSDEQSERRQIVGEVVSDKMDKTITVRVDRRQQHPRYKKYLTRSTKFKAHDEEERAEEGDVVELEETRPISRSKRWRLVDVLEEAP